MFHLSEFKPIKHENLFYLLHLCPQQGSRRKSMVEQSNNALHDKCASSRRKEKRNGGQYAKNSNLKGILIHGRKVHVSSIINKEYIKLYYSYLNWKNEIGKQF